MNQTPPISQQVSDDYKLLLTPPFAAMTKITDNLFLTGVGGMTRTNFTKNHIDFVVNITTDAPFWQQTESMRVALEDDSSANMLAHFDQVVDKIHEAITKRDAHVLVHCVAGVSRSATIVIAYLMKFRRLDLKSAFNYCYNLRPVIRPNNGFMVQLINYERQLFGRPSSVQMVEADVEGTLISVPNFFLEEHPRLVLLEVLRTRDLLRMQSQTSALNQMEVGLHQQPQQHQPQQVIQPQPQPHRPSRKHHSQLSGQHHRSVQARPTVRSEMSGAVVAMKSASATSSKSQVPQSAQTKQRQPPKSPTKSKEG